MRCAIFLVAVLALCATYVKCYEDANDRMNLLKTFHYSNEYFTNKLFEELWKKEPSKNTLSSPLSVHLLLTLLHQGAEGQTAAEIQKSLYLLQNNHLNRRRAKLLIDSLNDTKNITLELANSLVVSNTFPIKDGFKNLAKDSFNSEIFSLDFSEPKHSADTINKWVNQKTHDKIKKIIEADEITASTRMLLLDAIYFKGAWKSGFDQTDTRKQIFHLDENNHKLVDTMFVQDKFLHGRLAELDATFIELPYKNEDIKMTIIVPNQVNGLPYIIENLRSINESRLAKAGYKGTVQLFLPKFKIGSTNQIKEPLEKLGVNSIFGNANFKSITDETIRVDSAIQKTFIEVNEEGSEAAAVTAVRVVSYAAPRQIIANRPFLYKIVDAKSQITLFIGTVCDPIFDNDTKN